MTLGTCTERPRPVRPRPLPGSGAGGRAADSASAAAGRESRERILRPAIGEEPAVPERRATPARTLELGEEAEMRAGARRNHSEHAVRDRGHEHGVGARALALLAAAVLPALLAPAPPAAADDVHLTNGRSFEGVVARIEGDRVAIRLHQGVIRLPRSRVARIVYETSPLETYLDRKRALTSARDATAADWLDLAVWARRHGLETAYGEAARLAAALDPGLDGLAPVMRDLGLEREGAGGSWYTHDELMRRRGMVRWNGDWVTPAERAALAEREDTERRRIAEARREAVETAVLAELATAIRLDAEAERAREQGLAYAPGLRYGGPTVWVGPGWFVPGHPHRHPDPHDDPGAGAPDPGGGDPGPGPAAGRTNRGGFRASDWIPGRLNPGVAPVPGSLGASSSRSDR